jgi:hypothetical protein
VLWIAEKGAAEIVPEMLDRGNRMIGYKNIAF